MCIDDRLISQTNLSSSGTPSSYTEVPIQQGGWVEKNKQKGDTTRFPLRAFILLVSAVVGAARSTD